MVPKRHIELDSRLRAHFATLRSWSVAGTVQRRCGSWQLYATVTGSALAMASSASAGSIVFTNGPVTVGPIANVAVTNVSQSSGQKTAVQKFILKTAHGANAGASFSFGVHQRIVDSNLNGSAFLGGSGVGGAGFLFTAVHDKVAKLSSNVKISAHSPVFSPIFEGGKAPVATTTQGLQSGWQPGKYGFAGFEIQTSIFHHTDYGWIQLMFNEGSNGLANGITVKDWAYDSSGNAILTDATGQSSGTPEPSTLAMALLAAGAAGVLALRRRRHSAA